MNIAYTQPNGIVAIVHAAPKSNLEQVLGPLTDEAYRAHVYKRSIPDGATNVHELSDDFVPDTDRTFRNAWVTDGSVLSVDMDKAREIHKQNLRSLRDPLLLAADVEMSKAYNDKTQQDAIEAKRQKLRDVTDDQSIAAATTPDELRAAIPKILVP